MQIQKCKGFSDLAPQDMALFRRVETAFRESCLGWGYQEVRTPTLEYLYLFTSVGTLTPGMLRRVYSFLDWDGWSGERVVLKPDATIPVARLYIDRLAGQSVARLCYVTNTFVFEETGTKSRERWQCGAELIGPNTSFADAELVALSLDVMQKLGLRDIEIRLSHAGLIRDLLSSLGLTQKEQEAIFDQILDGGVETLSQIKTDKPAVVEALSLLINTGGRSPGFLRNIRALFEAHIPQFQTSLDSFIATLDLIEALDCSYQIDLGAGKGFEYYTGLIFRLYAGDTNVGGGGRYDRLIPMMGGPQAPAAGFALYVDRLISLLPPERLSVSLSKRVCLKLSGDSMKVGMGLAERLRKAGLVVELAAGESQPAACGWLLEVRAKKPQFTLTDCGNGQKLACDSTADILVKLGCV